MQMGHRTLTVRFSITLTKRLEDARHKIVIVRLDDLATIELAGLGVYTFGKLVDEDLAVDFRRVHGGASLEKQIRFL